MPKQYETVFISGRTWEVQTLLCKEEMIFLAALDRGSIRTMIISKAQFRSCQKDEKQQIKTALKWIKRAAA